MSATLDEFWLKVTKNTNYRETFPLCNSLNMFEMLRGLDSMKRDDLIKFQNELSQSETITGIKYIRIEYAADVILNRQLPNIVPGDLQATNQVADAVNFLAELKNVQQAGPQFGIDGSIPEHYKPKIKQAINNLWKLNSDAGFIELFKSTLNTIMFPQRNDSTVYAQSLNKQVLHYAATSQNIRLKQTIIEDQESLKRKEIQTLAQAYTFAGEPNSWLLQSALNQSEQGLTAIILHELTHVAGVSGFGMAETAVLIINEKSPYKIPKVK